MKCFLNIFSWCIIITLLIGCSQKKEASQPLYEPAPGPFVRIAVSGKANAQVIVPSEPTYLEEFAASELQKYIKKISDAELPIIKEGNKSKYSTRNG